MRYFTQQLWLAFQTPQREAALKTWNRRFKAYQKSLPRVLPGLNSSGRRFFKDPLILHDGTLTRMEVGDRIFNTERQISARLSSRELKLRLFVLSNRAKQHCYILQYYRISKVELNLPGKIKLFGYMGKHSTFGDWGYDELSARRGLYRHEILFSSGATIVVEFRGFTMKRNRAI